MIGERVGMRSLTIVFLLWQLAFLLFVALLAFLRRSCHLHVNVRFFEISQLYNCGQIAVMSFVFGEVDRQEPELLCSLHGLTQIYKFNPDSKRIFNHHMTL